MTTQEKIPTHMTNAYQPYPAYKDSGVEWLGEIPEGWGLTRLKFESLIKARVGWHGLKSDEFTDVGPYLVTGSDFKGPEIQWENCYHCENDRYEQDPYIQLQNGDLLITKDGTIGKVALVQNLYGKATLNSGIFVVRPLSNRYTSKFYFWLLQSTVFHGFVDFYKTGSTIAHLYQNVFENLAFALPSLTEQTQIASFLDHETARIDTLIAKQETLIALLKEKRQAVISHAVTKGLNPNVEMKDSGVEWLGEVPAHWEVSAMKHTVNAIGDIDHYMPQTKDSGVPYVMTGDLEDFASRIDFDNCKKVSHRDFQNLSKKIKSSIGDVILARYATIGTVSYIDIDINFLVSYSCVTIKPNPEKLLGIYLFYFLKSDNFKIGIQNQINTNTQGNVGVGDLKQFKLVLPPINAQKDIVYFIDRKTNELDTLIQKAESAIYLMKERRTALISTAVTGKIDLRDWQAPQGEA